MKFFKNSSQPDSYSPTATVFIAIFIYFAAQIIAGLIFVIVPLLKHWSAERITEWMSSNAWVTFGMVALIEISTLALLYWFMKRKKLGFKFLGLGGFRPKFIAYILGGFAIYFLMFVVVTIIAKGLFPGLDLEQKQELGFNTSTQGWGLVPIFISLAILPPITEEMVVRGFLFRGLRTKLPLVMSAVITSLLFASAHLGESSQGLLWIAALDTFVLSIVLCFLREKTDSLWPSIGVHFLKNCLAFVVLFNIVQYLR